MESQKVLVVDDDHAIRVLVARVFARRGFETVSAHDGAEAIALLKEHPFSLVVLDLMMPRTDGLAVIEEISRLDNPPAVIVISAAAPSMVNRVPKDRVWKVISKPFEVTHLIAEAEAALSAASAPRTTSN